MSARSLELFALLGLSETLLTKGIMTQQIDFHLSGRRKGGLNYDLCEINDTPFPFILMIPQSATEQTLLDPLPLAGSGLSRVMTADIGAEDNNLNGDGDNDTRYAGHDNRNVSAKERDDGEPAALELDELQRVFSSVAQVPVTLGNAQWLTKFRTHHRCVDHYRIGHIFVAGDAAHIHSLAGGKG